MLLQKDHRQKQRFPSLWQLWAHLDIPKRAWGNFQVEASWTFKNAKGMVCFFVLYQILVRYQYIWRPSQKESTFSQQVASSQGFSEVFFPGSIPNHQKGYNKPYKEWEELKNHVTKNDLRNLLLWSNYFSKHIFNNYQQKTWMSLMSCFLLNETKLEGLKTPFSAFVICNSQAHPEIREMISVFVHQVRYRPKGYYCVEKPWEGGGWCYIFTKQKIGGAQFATCGLFCGHSLFWTKRVPISSTENIPRSLLRTVYMFLKN